MLHCFHFCGIHLLHCIIHFSYYAYFATNTNSIVLLRNLRKPHYHFFSLYTLFVASEALSRSFPRPFTFCCFPAESTKVWIATNQCLLEHKIVWWRESSGWGQERNTRTLMWSNLHQIARVRVRQTPLFNRLLSHDNQDCVDFWYDFA